jgi:predicted naringenin-chalcone synthase
MKVIGADLDGTATMSVKRRSATSQLAVDAPVEGQNHPRISGLALSDPPTSYTQEQVLDLLGLSDDEFAQRIFARCGVQKRQLDLDAQMLATTLQGRTQGVEEQLLSYAVEAVERLEIDPSQIGTVVSSTLYSLGGPTLAHRLVDHFGMDPATDKYHVVGVGCASAVPLMRMAYQSLGEQPAKKGLVVAAESMSGLLVGARPDDARSKTVGSAIFGDGCAAAVIDLEGDELRGPAILASKVHHVAGTLDAVTLKYSADDSYLHMVRELPDIAGSALGGLVDEFLQANGLGRADIEHWLIHPGGRRIVESAQQALDLSREQVEVSYQVLANHGNVGTPSIFYVLAQTLRERRPCSPERGLMVTIGPGVTVGLMLLGW